MVFDWEPFLPHIPKLWLGNVVQGSSASRNAKWSFAKTGSQAGAWELGNVRMKQQKVISNHHDRVSASNSASSTHVPRLAESAAASVKS